ncbi:MAG: CPBP family intramembrane glutamic endopeptidase [Pseudomonadota bacterium]
MGWVECITLFLIFPLIGIFGQAINILPLTILALLSSTVLLLSMTRSFHWADLVPVDALSEWRLLVGVSAVFIAGSFAVTTVFFPEELFQSSGGAELMLIAYPLLTALPVELVYRALFFRRFGYLFKTQLLAILVGAAANGLLYFMLSHALSGAVFGFVIGLVLGWAYLRSGQFALSVLMHWIAALAIWLIGPGLV